MMLTKVVRCIKCGRSVAAVDDGDWCRGCFIAGHLTDSEKSVLLAVRKLQPCTTREVGAEVGFSSTNTAQYHLRKLRQMGLVHWEDNKPRTLTERVEWPSGERV